MKVERPRIVVLDNEKTMREILTTQLTEQGYQVFPFENKGEALEWIVDIDPDLIISDLNSPGVTGYEFLSEIRGDPRTKEMPVLFLTGFNDIKNRIAAFDLGADDYVSKTSACRLEYLLTVVKRTLKKKRDRK